VAAFFTELGAGLVFGLAGGAMDAHEGLSVRGLSWRVSA
jgi:hypothetical protein